MSIQFPGFALGCGKAGWPQESNCCSFLRAKDVGKFSRLMLIQEE